MNLRVLRPRLASQLAVAFGALAFLLPHAYSYWIAQSPGFLDRESTLLSTTLLLLITALLLGLMSSQPLLRLSLWVMLGVMLGVLIYVTLTTDVTGGYVFGTVRPLSLWPVLYVLAFMITAPVVAVGALVGRGLGRVLRGPHAEGGL